MSTNDLRRQLNRMVERWKDPDSLGNAPVKDPIPASTGVATADVADQPGGGLVFPFVVLERHYKTVTVTGTGGCEFDVQEDQKYKVRDGAGKIGWIRGFDTATAIDVEA